MCCYGAVVLLLGLLKGVDAALLLDCLYVVAGVVGWGDASTALGVPDASHGLEDAFNLSVDGQCQWKDGAGSNSRSRVLLSVVLSGMEGAVELIQVLFVWRSDKAIQLVRLR